MNLHSDVLIITVTKIECLSVLKVFQEFSGKASIPISINDRIYHDVGLVNGRSVFMAQSEMGAGGLGASQQSVEKGITALTPSAVIMVGIAFGINAKKQSIGDILVSKRLLLYEKQRIGTEKSRQKIVQRGECPHASPWLLNLLRSADLYWDKKKAKVRFGLILSGEKLVDNYDYRQQLQEFEPEAIGGEMEGGGLYVTCQDKKVDWIIVKAICDWADGRKAKDKEDRQQIAARNAAQFVAHALQQVQLNKKTDIQESFSASRTYAIRQRLNRIFDDPQLDSFLLDYFPEVYDMKSRGMRKDEKLTLLIDYCRRNEISSQKLFSFVESFR